MRRPFRVRLSARKGARCSRPVAHEDLTVDWHQHSRVSFGEPPHQTTVLFLERAIPLPENSENRSKGKGDERSDHTGGGTAARLTSSATSTETQRLSACHGMRLTCKLISRLLASRKRPYSANPFFIRRDCSAITGRVWMVHPDDARPFILAKRRGPTMSGEALRSTATPCRTAYSTASAAGPASGTATATPRTASPRCHSAESRAAYP